MVRRLLLTMLGVALAVAVPVSAEEAVPDPGPLASCAPLDAACLDGLAETPCDAWDLLCTAESAPSARASESTAGCSVYSLDLSQGSPQTLMLDPDGCFREFLRRTLGWPPLDLVLPAIDTSADPFTLPF